MKKSLAIAFAPLLMWVGAVFGSDPTLVVIDNKLVKVESIVQPTLTITAPTNQIGMGEIVILTASVEGELPTFVKSRAYKWNVTEKGFVKQFWADGSKVIFGSGIKPTEIKVTCEVDLTYLVGREEIVKVLEQDLNVNVGQPEPSPPDPTPSPDLLGLAKMSYDWAISQGPADKAESAPIMARALIEIAAQIGHNSALITAKDILVNTKIHVNEELTKAKFNPVDWDPWSILLRDYAYSEYQAGRLTKPEDFKEAWTEVAKGLQQVH